MVCKGWDAKQVDYTALLTKDNLAVLGHNTKVKFITPDGFTGYLAFKYMPEVAGSISHSQDFHRPFLRRTISRAQAQSSIPI